MNQQTPNTTLAHSAGRKEIVTVSIGMAVIFTVVVCYLFSHPTLTTTTRTIFLLLLIPLTLMTYATTQVLAFKDNKLFADFAFFLAGPLTLIAFCLLAIGEIAFHLGEEGRTSLWLKENCWVLILPQALLLGLSFTVRIFSKSAIARWTADYSRNRTLTSPPEATEDAASEVDCCEIECCFACLLFLIMAFA